MMTNRLLSRFWMIALLLGAFWLAAREMAADPIWYDEYWSFYYAGAAPQYGPITLAETWMRVGSINHELNPPGYYLALNLWGHLAGWTPFAARVLSALWGVLAVAWIYRLGSDLSGRTAGLAAATALAGSAFFIQYMHEIRAYMLLPLLVLVTFWAYRQFLRRGTRWSAALFMGSLGGLLYAHYMGIPFILAAGIYHLLFAPKNRRWWGVVGLVSGAGLLFLPWASVALSAVQHVSIDPARSFYANEPLPLVALSLTTFSNHSVALLAIFGWYALQRRGAALVGFFLGATFALILLANALFHFASGPHYLLALLPLLMLVVGLGAARLSQLQRRPAVLLVVWLAAGGWLIFKPADTRTAETASDWQLTLPWDELADRLRPYQQPGETVVYYLPAPVPHWVHAPVAAYYLYDLPARVEPKPSFVVSPSAVPEDQAMTLHLVESLADKSPEAYQEEAHKLLEGLDTVWVAYNPTYLPGPFTRPAFEHVLADQGLESCPSLVATPQLTLTLFAHLPDSAPAYRFGEGVDFYLLTPITETVRNHLSLILGWKLDDAVPRGVYSVALHIENEHGELVAQADAGLPSEARSCQPISVPLDGLPTGTYTARIMVYNWQSGERLAAGADDRPVLTTFTLDSADMGKISDNS